MDVITYDEWRYICNYLDLRDYNSMIYVSKWFRFIVNSFIKKIVDNTVVNGRLKYTGQRHGRVKLLKQYKVKYNRDIPVEFDAGIYRVHDGNVVEIFNYFTYTKYVIKSENTFDILNQDFIRKSYSISITEYRIYAIYKRPYIEISKHWENNINTIYCNGKKAYSYKDGRSDNKTYYQSYKNNKIYKVGKRVSKYTSTPRGTLIDDVFITFRKNTYIVKVIRDGKLINTSCYTLQGDICWCVDNYQINMKSI